MLPLSVLERNGFQKEGFARAYPRASMAPGTAICLFAPRSRARRAPLGLENAALLKRALRLVLQILFIGATCQAAWAVQSVRVPLDADAIDLASAVEHYSAQGDRIQVSTAPGADGIVRRIEVSALEAGARKPRGSFSR